MSATNRRFTLASRPSGAVDRSHFSFDEVPVEQPGPGQVLVKVDYISLDPAMRGWLNDDRSYIPPVKIGEVMRAGGVGTVVTSNDPGFAAGDAVSATTGVQDFAVARAKDLTKIDLKLAPAPRWLGALGMPGITAYFGLLDVGAPKAGETVVVSGAAGAVGTIVGQIARLKGCRVVGIAGGEPKCRYLVDELKFDAAIDYKSEDVRKGLKAHCPDGIDVYFDNVGGEILDMVLGRLARRARIVICGAISQYNDLANVRGPKNYMALLVNRARMEGFVVFDYVARAHEAVEAIAGWIGRGELIAREDIVEGLETFPETLQKLFKGENFGKLCLKV